MKNFEWRCWTGGYGRISFVRGPARWVAASGADAERSGKGDSSRQEPRWVTYHPASVNGLLRRFTRVTTLERLRRFVSRYGLINSDTVDDPGICLQQARAMRRVLDLWEFLGSGMPEALTDRIESVQTQQVVNAQKGDGDDGESAEDRVYTFEHYAVPSGNKGAKVEISVYEGGKLASVRTTIAQVVTEALAWHAAPVVEVVDGRFTLDFRPKNLMGYLWLLVAHEVVEHKERKVCSGCSKDFWVPSGSRLDLQYCSTACRQRTKRARRARREAASDRSTSDSAG